MPTNAANGILQVENDENVLDLVLGHPDPSLLPVLQWRRAAADATDTYEWRALAYGSARGPGPLIEWLSTHLSELDGASWRPNQIVVTGGASHAISLLTHLLAEPGDAVIVDAPTFHYGLKILRDRGLHVVAAESDAQGLIPVAVADQVRALRRTSCRVPLLYTVPTFCNPTGRSLPEDRRLELVRIADQLGVTVIEDDTYRELGYGDTVPPSLWALADGYPVVRVGSFSKTVAPGVRLGWIQADPDLVGRIADLGFIDSGGGVNHNTALTMASFCSMGSYDDHLRFVRRSYRARRDALVTGLEACGLPIEAPAGGWFLWLPVPQGLTTEELRVGASLHGVAFTPGEEFHPNGETGCHIRLSFSFLDPPQLVEAAQRLAAAIESAREFRRSQSSQKGNLTAGTRPTISR